MAESAFYNNWKNSGLPASGGVISSSNGSNAYTGYKGGNTNTAKADPKILDLMNMGPKDFADTVNLLKAAGYIKSAPKKYNKDLGNAYVLANQELVSEAQRTGRPTLTLRQFLVENPKTPSGTGSGTANLPSRNIYKYTEADRIKIIDDVSQTLRGQGVTEEDKKAQWYKDLRSSIDNMINTGTLSTTQKVKNPKTGKLEVQTVATPGFSQEKAAAVAETTIRKATPEDVARQERVGFTDWMFKQLGGGASNA